MSDVLAELDSMTDIELARRMAVRSAMEQDAANASLRQSQAMRSTTHQPVDFAALDKRRHALAAAVNKLPAVRFGTPRQAHVLRGPDGPWMSVDDEGRVIPFAATSVRVYGPQDGDWDEKMRNREESRADRILVWVYGAEDCVTSGLMTRDRAETAKLLGLPEPWCLEDAGPVPVLPGVPG